LRLPNQQIGKFPGNLLVGYSPLSQSHQLRVEPPAANDVGDDDRIRRRARGAPLAVEAQKVWIDGIQPQLGPRSNEGSQPSERHDLPFPISYNMPRYCFSARSARAMVCN